ncbi:MAG: ComEA family DNA-binding protein [Candidatus Omnitrophica bacterium]|nr:ComEA family DNA-binding protein [Candidatus Omnitrophota bacterium]
MLTIEERRVLVFLISLIVIGMGINYLKKNYFFLNFSFKNIYLCEDEEGKMNLNEIDKEALIRLPGIGEKLACRIIEYREKYGGFKEIEELRKIKGIKPYCYEKIKDYLYVK